MSCTLYILQSQVKETYYTGISDDADTRSIYHNVEKQEDESQGYMADRTADAWFRLTIRKIDEQRSIQPEKLTT